MIFGSYIWYIVRNYLLPPLGHVTTNHLVIVEFSFLLIFVAGSPIFVEADIFLLPVVLLLLSLLLFFGDGVRSEEPRRTGADSRTQTCTCRVE